MNRFVRLALIAALSIVATGAGFPNPGGKLLLDRIVGHLVHGG